MGSQVLIFTPSISQPLKDFCSVVLLHLTLVLVVCRYGLTQVLPQPGVLGLLSPSCDVPLAKWLLDSPTID